MIITVLIICVTISTHYFLNLNIIDPTKYRKTKMILTLWYFASYFRASYAQKLNQIILDIRDNFIDNLDKAVFTFSCFDDYFLCDFQHYYLSNCFCFTLFWINYFYNPRQYPNLSFSLGMINIFISIYARNSLSFYQSAFVFLSVSFFSFCTIWRSSVSGQSFIYICIFLLDIMAEAIAFSSNELNRVKLLINTISFIMDLWGISVILIFVLICFCMHLDSFDEYIRLLDKKKDNEFYFKVAEVYTFLLALNLEAILVANLWSNSWLIKNLVLIFISASLGSLLVFPDDDNRKFMIFASNVIATYFQVYSIKTLWNLI
ncbi:unnamed protein product [Blepharisma stoltei]|uniref:Uncharacterized protein n=1 Tax=Blepharisma stoltei TaxID=1481888 RepID=A0AAU9IQ94_9CILI|nr:unnamed protein product [Blepharisma stoltei]